MANFPIYPLSRFESGQTTIRRPRHFSQFSFDGDHQCQVGSEESLRYYYPAHIDAPGTSMPRIDLSSGYESWVKLEQNLDGHLDALLATIQAHEESLLEKGETDVKVKADIITWRGMMTKIVTAAVDQYSDFEMNATCFQDTIYIEENTPYAVRTQDEDNMRQRQPVTKNDKGPPPPPRTPPDFMQYWGYKFESISTLPRPWAECSRQEIDQRDNDIVNNRAQYCSVVRTGIGQSTLIIGGEVDCIMGEKPSNLEDPIPWVELKTSREPGPHQRQQQTFERKLCRMWAQSFLLGVPTIIIGFRDEDGFLTRLMELETQKIPGLVARQNDTWNGNVCINLTNQFLELLKQTIKGKDGLWRIKRGKDSKVISIVQVETTGTGQVVSAAFKQHREKLLAVEIAKKLAGTSTADV